MAVEQGITCHIDKRIEGGRAAEQEQRGVDGGVHTFLGGLIFWPRRFESMSSPLAPYERRRTPITERAKYHRVWE